MSKNIKIKNHYQFFFSVNNIFFLIPTLYHKMITTFRSSYMQKSPQTIIYKNYKNFNAQDFLNDLETSLGLEGQAST